MYYMSHSCRAGNFSVPLSSEENNGTHQCRSPAPNSSTRRNAHTRNLLSCLIFSISRHGVLGPAVQLEIYGRLPQQPDLLVGRVQIAGGDLGGSGVINAADCVRGYRGHDLDSVFQECRHRTPSVKIYNTTNRELTGPAEAGPVGAMETIPPMTCL